MLTNMMLMLWFWLSYFFQVVKLKIKFIVEMLNMYFFFVEYYKYLGSSSFITESFLWNKIGFIINALLTKYFIIITLQK